MTSLLPKSILLKARNPVHFPTETFNPDFDQLRASARATNYARSRGLVNPSVSVLTTTIEDDVPSKPSKHLGIARDLTSSEKEEVPTNKSVSWNKDLKIKFIDTRGRKRNIQTGMHQSG